jgi:hypothetical protein
MTNFQFRRAQQRAGVAIKLAKQFKKDTDLECHLPIAADDGFISELDAAGYRVVADGSRVGKRKESLGQMQRTMTLVLEDLGTLDGWKYGSADKHGTVVAEILFRGKRKKKGYLRKEVIPKLNAAFREHELTMDCTSSFEEIAGSSKYAVRGIQPRYFTFVHEDDQENDHVLRSLANDHVGPAYVFPRVLLLCT